MVASVPFPSCLISAEPQHSSNDGITPAVGLGVSSLNWRSYRAEWLAFEKNFSMSELADSDMPLKAIPIPLS